MQVPLRSCFLFLDSALYAAIFNVSIIFLLMGLSAPFFTFNSMILIECHTSHPGSYMPLLAPCRQSEHQKGILMRLNKRTYCVSVSLHYQSNYSQNDSRQGEVIFCSWIHPCTCLKDVKAKLNNAHLQRHYESSMMSVSLVLVIFHLFGVCVRFLEHHLKLFSVQMEHFTLTRMPDEGRQRESKTVCTLVCPSECVCRTNAFSMKLTILVSKWLPS